MSTFYKEFSVDPTTRKLIDASPAVAVVQHDANVDGILFHIPASFDSVDLTDSGTKLQVFYMLPGGDVTYVAPLTAYTPTSDMDASYKYYAWNFANSVLEKSGLVSFSFCVQNATTNQDWNTRVAQLQIADTLDHTDSAISPGTKITSSIDAAIESAVSAYVDSQIKTYDTEISAELDKLNHAFDNLSLQYGEDGLVYVFSNGEPVGEGVELKYQGYVDVTGINLDQTDVKITETDGTVQLTATVLPDNASNKHVRWKTSAEDIATVSKKGLVKAVKNGNAVITAETVIGGYTSTCNVLVKMPIAVESIALSADAKDAHVGDTTAAPTVTILPADASNKAVKWSSSNTTVATVDADTGAVKGLYEGTSVITATTVSGGKTASYTLTVSAAVTYPKTGLVVDFDAINNAGAGKAHDDTASTWVDLSGNGHDIDLTASKDSTTQSKLTSDLRNHPGFNWTDDTLNIRTANGYFVTVDDTAPKGIAYVVSVQSAKLPENLSVYISNEPDSSTGPGYYYKTTGAPALCRASGSLSGDDTPTYIDGSGAKRGVPIMAKTWNKQYLGSKDGPAVDAYNQHAILIYTEDTDGNYSAWMNGKKVFSGSSKAASYAINKLCFIPNFELLRIHHLSVYSRALTDQECKDTTDYLNSVYHDGDIGSVTTALVSSGTVPPYTSALGTSGVTPIDKTSTTTFTYETTDDKTVEVSTVD